jgi:DHA1 family bicyclomycin/chloramphenicol resistance-like MFS transporter
MARAFGAEVAEVQLTLSLFLAGLAVGQLVYGPLSDRFGRRPVLIVGLAIYVGASFACMLAPTIEFLIALRFLQAVGACVGVVLSRAVVRDVHGREGAARVLSYLSAALAIAPLLGPVLGGYLEIWFGWRANFAVLVAYGIVTLAGVGFFLPETNREPDHGAIAPLRMLATYAMLAGERRYLGYALAATFAYSGIFCFISGSSFVLIDMIGLTPEAYGYAFAAIVVGYIVGAVAAGRLARPLGHRKLIAAGGAIQAAGGLVLIGLALLGHADVVSIVLPSAIYMVGTGLVMPNSMAGAIGPYPRAAGAAAALLGFTQMTVAALIGAAIGHAADGTQYPMVVALALCSGVGPACYWLLVRPWVAEPVTSAPPAAPRR